LCVFCSANESEENSKYDFFHESLMSFVEKNQESKTVLEIKEEQPFSATKVGLSKFN